MKLLYVHEAEGFYRLSDRTPGEMATLLRLASSSTFPCRKASSCVGGRLFTFAHFLHAQSFTIHKVGSVTSVLTTTLRTEVVTNGFQDASVVHSRLQQAPILVWSFISDRKEQSLHPP